MGSYKGRTEAWGGSKDLDDEEEDELDEPSKVKKSVGLDPDGQGQAVSSPLVVAGRSGELYRSFARRLRAVLCPEAQSRAQYMGRAEDFGSANVGAFAVPLGMAVRDLNKPIPPQSAKVVSIPALLQPGGGRKARKKHRK